MTNTARARLCTVATCRRDDTPRVVDDGAYLCRVCTERTAANIAALPTAYADLGRALTAAGGTAQRVTGTHPHPLPIRPEVADVRHEIRAWLVAEVRMWRDELELRGRPAPDPAALAGWLRVHLAAARHREWADTTHDAARALRGRARALVDLPRDRAVFPVGPCPEAACTGLQGTVGGLTGHVWARVPADPAEPAELACNACGRTWAATEWAGLGRRMSTA